MPEDHHEDQFPSVVDYGVDGVDGAPRGIAGVCGDTTARHRHEGRLRILAEASRLLFSSLDPKDALERVVRLGVPLLADWMAVDLVGPDGSLQCAALAGPDEERTQFVREMIECFPIAMEDVSPVLEALRTCRTRWFPNVPGEPLASVARSEEHLELLRSLRLRSALIVPLVARGAALGALELGVGESGRAYDAEDVALVEELAHRAALALDNARL